MNGGGHGAVRGADRRGRTRATALGGQGAVAPQPRPCRTSNDEKRVPRTRTVIRTHSAARGEARLTAEPASLAPASPTPDARRGSGATPSTLKLCSPAARTTTRHQHLRGPRRARRAARPARLSPAGSCSSPRARQGPRAPTPGPVPAPDFPTGAGRDFDLPRHSHYSRVIPMVFQHSGGRDFDLPRPLSLTLLEALPLLKGNSGVIPRN